MLNWVKALTLHADNILNEEKLAMFKNAGFGGVDFGFDNLLNDENWEETIHRCIWYRCITRKFYPR